MVNPAGYNPQEGSVKPLRRSVLRNTPFEEKAMRRTIRSAFGCILLALACLIAATACSQPEQQVPGNVDMLIVKVIDDTQVKTIGPQGNADITHYVITVINEAEDIRQQSGYLAKGAQFVVSNVPAGEWYAIVDAYVSRDDGSYVKVAGATSAKTLVNAGQKTVLEVVLDSLDQVLSGDVSLTLRMPALLASEGSTFHYQYTISGLGDDLSLFIYNSPVLEGATGAGGIASIVIDALDAGLMQGSYMFGITVFDGTDEAGSTVVRRGVDVMRLVNGLPAAGVIDLASYASDQTFQVTVTDSIGDILVPEIVDGKDVYVLDGNSGELTITLLSPLSANETIEWYVDGQPDETVDTSGAADGIYVLSFDHGSHTVTAIVRDTNTLMSVGSIDEFKVVRSNIEFIEKIDLSSLFSYETNDDGVNTITITGFKEGAVDKNIQPDNDRIFEIPSQIDGKTVTQIGTNAFGQYGRRNNSVTIYENSPEYKILSGKLVLPDSLILIGEGAFDMTLFNDIDFGSGLQKIMYNGLNFYDDFIDKINGILFNLRILHLEFPSSLKYIGPDIIYGRFDTIYFPENIETLTTSEGNHSSSYDSRYTCISTDDHIYDMCIYSGQPKESFLATTYNYLGTVAKGSTASQQLTDPSQWFFNVPRKEYHAIINNDSRPYHVPQPVIAVDDGVSISCEKAFAHIYYTLDGTDPDVSDNLYEGDMIMDIMDSLADKEEVTLKAVAYVGNGIYSDVAVKTISLSDVIFNFELNEDQRSYTLTGIKLEALPITDGLEIPAYHNGLPVTAIGTLAFQSDELKMSFPEAYNKSILGMAAETGYQGNNVEEAFDMIVEALSKAKELGAYDGGQVVMDIAWDDAESLAEGLAYVIAFSMIDATPLEISGAITIPETVGRIGAAAFMNCRITSVEVANVYPSSVSEGIIETCAFFGCPALESVTIPEGFTIIGHNAFWECLSLKNIIIPDSITTIGERAFAMTSLTNITIPESVTTIGAGAFYYCSLLESIALPGNIISIGYGTFKDCFSLTDITIPEEVTSIGIGAFAECSSLKSITIPEHVASIGSEAFIRCASLTSIFIPEKVTEIGARVFQTCDELVDVYCESLSKPDGWNDKWLGDSSAQVHWGCSDQ